MNRRLRSLALWGIALATFTAAYLWVDDATTLTLEEAEAEMAEEKANSPS